MKKLLLALAIFSAPDIAEQSKPVAAQAEDTMRPTAEAIGKGTNELVYDFLLTLIKMHAEPLS
ncbi:hypothetical protein K5Q02_09645 [Pseudomonas sp. MM211]|uniref:hypothetical protein n=1 Tax=Pseudomonas sp. MM211 TaxID=2866808 RepID=UPI001CED6893|nr:hypothetical protein [Pseudomonas sp. MM211]UCJ18600.1 hypothetical protein K5Q02_09645 [Pseudomonas sp. MM211]